MKNLLQVFDRSVYWVEGGTESPAVYFIADKEAGGILVNAPGYSSSTVSVLREVMAINFLFLPSRLGAKDLNLWQEEGVKLIAYGEEGRGLGCEIDVELDRKTRLSRTIDFLPMAGRTRASCALRLKNKPGAIFFGPILEPADSGQWPTLVMHNDDYDQEARLFGVLGLQDLRYEYAFTDRFNPENFLVGPGASTGIQQALASFLA